MKGGIYPTKYGYQVRFGRKLTKHFKHLVDAERFLTGIRFKSDEGTFDIRDYQKDNPLGFENLVGQFLHSKRLLKGVKKYEQRLRFGVQGWGNRNIKSIGFREIETLLVDLMERAHYSSKYRKDIRDCIKMFYKWCLDTGEIKYEQMPKFPKVKAHMAYRSVIGKETQENILRELESITKFNPRIYIGVRFLCTYINTRPSELISIREKDIDLNNQRILIRGKYAKTGKPKYVYLLASDCELLGRFPRSFPSLVFFRHQKGRGGNGPNTQFGKGYLYKWWKKACSNLGISGVDLYGGTRHSSAIDLRKRHSPEAVKRATMHGTNEAFERYLQVTGDELRELYADTRGEVVEIGNVAKMDNTNK